MTATNQDAIQAGWNAHGRDGEKIGEIEEVGREYLLVTKGFIFTTDLYIPRSAIGDVVVNERRVYLAVNKDEIDSRGWNQPPIADTSQTTGTSASTATAGRTGRETQLGEGEEVRMPLREEQLRAAKTTEQAGEVRVGKSVREEQASIDVPVTHDEVEIKRVATDRPATGDEGALGEGGTIRVPVTSERVEVTKEPRVTEEIEISRRPATETQHVSETVRREQAEVDEAGNVLTGAGASMTGAQRDLDDPAVSGMHTGQEEMTTREKADTDDDLLSQGPPRGNP